MLLMVLLLILWLFMAWFIFLMITWLICKHCFAVIDVFANSLNICYVLMPVYLLFDLCGIHSIKLSWPMIPTST